VALVYFPKICHWISPQIAVDAWHNRFLFLVISALVASGVEHVSMKLCYAGLFNQCDSDSGWRI